MKGETCNQFIDINTGLPNNPPPIEEVAPEQPPVDNDHVAEGAEKFPETETTPEAVDNTPAKTSFAITFEDGSLIRTYSVEIHGENAEALASEFVSSHPGTKIA